MVPERVVRVRVRTILTLLLTVIGVAVVLAVIWIAHRVITWIFIALFLALAINPAVDWLQRRGVRRRGLAVAIAYFGVFAFLAAISAAFVPTLVDQVRDFVNKLPDYVEDITKGRGRLGFLETKYEIVERVRKAVREGGATKVFGLSGYVVSVTRGVITAVVGTLTIAFMTFFMLLEGPNWVERFYGLLPAQAQPRWRKVGYDIYRTVGGYVTGNLLISLIAGGSTTVVLLIMGVPFYVALGLLTAILDLIPLAGATLALIIVGTVAFIHSIPAGLVVVAFFIVYQQLENHLLQPVVYGRTVQLSPLAVLIAVLIGAELAGIIGALAAIPVAGAIQVVLVDLLRHRRGDALETSPRPEVVGPPDPAT